MTSSPFPVSLPHNAQDSSPDPRLLKQQLAASELVDIDSDRRFSRLTCLTADIFDVPICLVTLFDDKGAWIKSAKGIQPGYESSHCAGLCDITLQKGYYEASYQGNETIFDDVCRLFGYPGLIFYAGQALHGAEGQPVGTLCVFDRGTRQLNSIERQRLAQLVELVEHEILLTERLRLTHTDLAEHVLFDPATSLPRQLVGNDCLMSVLESADQNHTKVVLAVVHFIQYHDLATVYSEQERDAAMNMFSQRLRSLSGPCGMVSRPLSDRILVARGDISSASMARQWAERIYHEVIRPYDIAEGQRSAQVAIGACLYPDQATSAEELSRRAHIAKPSQAGFSFYDDGDESRLLRRDQVTRAFIEALAESRLELVFQPIVSHISGRVTACEALARWEDAILGKISPDEFIPIAEDSPLLCREFTRWVLISACQAACIWNQELDEQVKVNVNVSGSELYREDFIADVDEALASAGLAPELLVIEVTEQALIERIDIAIKTLDALKRRGVMMALDDFGTGYSSLSYLRQLPLDTLKIDRSFLIGLETDSTAQELTRGIVNIGCALSMSVVAEGVETEAQRLALSEVGIEHMQGYYWHRPMASEALGDILGQANATAGSIKPDA